MVMNHFCHSLSLGLAIKAKVYKGAGQELSPGVTFYALGNVERCEGMNLHKAPFTFVSMFYTYSTQLLSIIK